MDTSGFYKNDNGMILCGPNFVDAGSYYLSRDQKDSFTYPYNGWYWFDSEEEAYAFWNLPLPQKDPPQPPFIPN